MVVSCEICGKQFDSFRGLNGHRNAHIKRAESFTPPASAVKAAKKGLAQRKEWGRGGLSPSEAKAQGIDSGVTRARKIASGSVSRHDIRRMSAFNRHRKNNRPDKKMPDGGPTAGTIAWNLWGGSEGVNWAKKKSAAMNAEDFETPVNTYVGPFRKPSEGQCKGSKRHISRGYLGAKYVSLRPCRNPAEDMGLCKNCYDSQKIRKEAEDMNAETLDYNSFTNDMEALLAKYCQLLLTYETEYQSKERGGDGIMEVFMRFKPYNAYFDDVDFDAEAPHYYGDCGDCKQPMMLGIRIKNRRGFDELTSSKICQECDHVVCGSCQPQAKVCPHCNETFNADFGPVDEEGQLAKALAAVREKSKRYAPTPLRLTKLPHPDQKTLKDFEADEWKLLPRDAKGRWQKPVRSESINELRDSLQTSVPAISELLEMYGGDTPNNRYKLYNDLQSLKIDAMDSALPDDSTPSLDMDDMSWMTPSEYYQYVLEEPLDISDDIEDDTQTIEFQDRFVRYTAMTMSPQVIDALIEENELEIVSDLFADPAEAEGEIAFLKAVKRYQRFSEEYAAE